MAERLCMILAFVVLAHVPPSSQLKFSTIRNCIRPMGGEDGASHQADRAYNAAMAGELGANEGTGISINISAAEFYRSFASIFRLSDGSRINMPADGRRLESLRYMQEILHATGVHVNETASRDSAYQGDILQVCGKVSIINFIVIGKSSGESHLHAMNDAATLACLCAGRSRHTSLGSSGELCVAPRGSQPFAAVQSAVHAYSCHRLLHG